MRNKEYLSSLSEALQVAEQGLYDLPGVSWYPM